MAAKATEKAVIHEENETALDAHSVTALDAHETEDAHEGSGIHIALSAEKIGDFMGLPITNTLLTGWIIAGLLIVIAMMTSRRLKMIPGRVQAFFETLFEGAYDYMASTFESRERARTFFPLIVTVFLFIALANMTEFTPGIGSITVVNGDGETVPLFRSMNTDLNMTLGLTIIAVMAIEIAGVATLGFFAYAGKFINFSSPINFIAGLIELISEVSRLVSFSFRLFGNIFAGEVLIAVVAFFVPYLLPVPLMAFEMFIGIIQGLVFAMLILFFVKLAVMNPHEAH